MDKVGLSGKYQTYPEYKDSGVEWIGEIPENWNIKKLGYVATLKSGDAITTEKIENTGKYPVYGGNGFRGYTDEYNHCGDYILIGRQGALCGNINYGYGEFWASEHAVVVYPSVKLSIKWLGETLREMDLNQYNVSAAQPGLAVGNITCLKIPFPDEYEQQKIANFLNHETAKIDTLIDKQQQLIKLLKEKRQAVISHAVTKGLNPNAPMRDSGVEWLGEVPEHWDVSRLKQVINAGSSISYGIVQPGEPLNDGVPFVQTTNMSKGIFDVYDLQKTTMEIARSYPRSTLTGGEVILGIRASIGAAYVVPDSLKGCNLSRGVARIIPNKKILSEYLVLYFKSGAVDNYWGLSKQGSTFSEVSIETVKEIFLPIPPIEEQKDVCSFIVSAVDRLDIIISSAVNAIQLIKERRTALISAAVTGKIDVRDWVAPESSNNTMDSRLRGNDAELNAAVDVNTEADLSKEAGL